jgi:AcrR family transcriptional regulator
VIGYFERHGPALNVEEFGPTPLRSAPQTAAAHWGKGPARRRRSSVSNRDGEKASTCSHLFCKPVCEAVLDEQGYRRTQMADVAKALGVAKGTVYLDVESKDTLFDLVARCADQDRPFEKPPALPNPTPNPSATLKYVRERLAKNQVPAALTAALGRSRVPDPRAELEEIVRELYDALAHNRRGIKLLDRSARDYPELAALWFEGARGGLVGRLGQYLEDRSRRKLLRPVPDAAVAARLLIETVMFWAVHRHWDPHPQPMDESVAKETVVRFIVSALAKE